VIIMRLNEHSLSSLSFAEFHDISELFFFTHGCFFGLFGDFEVSCPFFCKKGYNTIGLGCIVAVVPLLYDDTCVA